MPEVAIAAPAVPPALLEVRGLVAGHGGGPVLRGLDLTVAAGEIVALLGRNGVGRSTALQAVMGRLPCCGSVRLDGVEMAGWPPHRIARAGIGYVPEGRDIFPTLTVRQNLLLGEKPGRAAATAPARWGEEAVLALFPDLRQRLGTRAGVLSGGEQQMLAIGRSLMGDPRLLMVDEPTEGLAPMVVERIGTLLEATARRGVGVLLVEQKLSLALRISQRVYLMGHGRVVFEGRPAALQADAALRREWLEL